MLSKETLDQGLGNVLERTDTAGFDREVDHGRVRDSYRKGDRRVIVVSDRLSAFDRVLCTIPFKGQALNEMAAFYRSL